MTKEKEVKLDWVVVSTLLREGLKQFVGQVDVVVGVLRGGAVCATIASHVLQVPVGWVQAKSYTCTRSAGDSISVQNFNVDSDLVEGKRVLIVDDVWDSGRTMFAVTELVLAFRPKSVCSFTLCVKDPKRSWKFDVTALMVYDKDDWIIFPWE